MQRVAAFNYVIQARQLASSGSYARAFELYFTVFEICPQLKGRVEREFRLLLAKLNEKLYSDNHAYEIFINFERALEAYPDNVVILCDIGGYFFKYGYMRESSSHYQEALGRDAGCVTAEKNLNSVKSFMVERWHFRMLNDRVRNKAYRDALLEMIRPLQEKVLDLGTGTGLLALYARQCNPKTVAACDGSLTMIEVARNVISKAGIKDIILVNKDSTSMTYKDIKGKCSLLVTEIFDAGLLGEGALQTLVHARENLITPTGKFMPESAEVFVTAVQSPFLSSRYRMSCAALAVLGLEQCSVHLFGDEPYDSEDVADFLDVAHLTTPTSIFKINFNSLQDMKEKLKENKVYESTLSVVEDGRMDAIVVWFNLHLTENIMITTDPNVVGRAQAWQQAVFYDYVPSTVMSSETISLQFSTQEGKLSLLNSKPENMHHVSADVIRFLNDEEYIKIISSSIAAICIYLCQSNKFGDLSILDFCPFPVFGLMMLRRGAKSLTCYVKSLKDEQFLITVLTANSIPLSRVKIFYEKELTLDMFKEQKFHAAYVNFLDLSGDVNANKRDLFRELKTKCMLPGGLVLPHSVFLEGQLVASEKLRMMNRVDDSNIGTIKVARFINKYQVSLYLHLDIIHLHYTPLSKVCSIANCCEAITSGVIDVEITESGLADAVFCWYKIQLIENGEIISTDRKHSFVDCMAFLADPRVSLLKGVMGNVICCTDKDECFKLVIDSEVN